MAEAAPIFSVLSEIGSRKSIIQTMRLSQDPAVLKFLKTFDSLPTFERDNAGVPWEAIVLVSGVSPNELLGATVMAFRKQQAQKSALRAMRKHPKVLSDTIFFASYRDGSKDRQMLHQAVGFLPSPKGTSINFNFPGDNEPADVPDTGNSVDPNDLFPMISDKQQRWQENRQKLLESK